MRLIALALLLVAGTARAHSELRATSPADGAVLAEAPARLELHFNEAVQVTLLRLRRAEGAAVPLPARPIRERRDEAVALPPLPPGQYQAEWRAISADGHAIGGSLRFRVGAP